MSSAHCRTPSFHPSTEAEKAFRVDSVLCIILMSLRQMFVSFVNPDLSGWIREGKMSINLVAINLALIFASILSSEIGLKFWGEIGSLPGFGKVIINAFSISSGREEE